jgi:[ribosomal protein S5]-alanine N-acetyltransferase
MKKNEKSIDILEGKRIYLREIKVEDVNQNYCGWMNDPDVNKYLESRFAVHSIASLRKYVKNIINDRLNVFFAIILKTENKHIGNIKLGPINNLHNVADIGIIIGEKDCWGKGYATEAINLVVNYAFTRLNLHKITAGCYATNKGSLNAFLKAGFSQEGVRKQHCFSEGKYVDDIVLGIIKSEKIQRSWRKK